jgi:hypothetical protein
MALFSRLAGSTLFVFYIVWAAMHDITHGEADLTLEYAALVISVPVFVLIYRRAVLLLPSRQKKVWLVGTALMVFLFDVAAISARLRPKYALDPLLGSVFLVAGIPLLTLIFYHLVRECLRGREVVKLR